VDSTNAMAEAYRHTRERVIGLVTEPGAGLDRPVPACPAWCVHDLVAHLVGMPTAIAAGQLPTGPLQEWLDGLVAERAEVPVQHLAQDWRALDPALPSLLGRGAGLLLDDLAVHEHDLRAALGRPDPAALEVDVVLPRALQALADPVAAAGLAPLEVRSPEGVWATGEGRPGWSLDVGPWEALRALSSRRTAQELRALPGGGDAEPYLSVLDAHLPLPRASLNET
jgi:hypothetical protein